MKHPNHILAQSTDITLEYLNVRVHFWFAYFHGYNHPITGRRIRTGLWRATALTRP